MINYKKIAREFGVDLIIIKKGDGWCSANGEETYIDRSFAIIPNAIYLGIYKSQELKTLSFFHELAHCTGKFRGNFKDMYGIEKAVWNYTFTLAKERGYTFSKASEEWVKKQLQTYKYDTKRKKRKGDTGDCRSFSNRMSQLRKKSN
jgi:hypothetical protein